MEDRSKRPGTVRPQCGEDCESQLKCDRALTVKSDGNDIELNGETNDGGGRGDGIRWWCAGKEHS